MEKYSLLTPNQKSHSAHWLHFPQMVTKLLETESYLLYFGLQQLSDGLKLCCKTCTQSTKSTTSEPNACPPQSLNASSSSSSECGFSYSRFPSCLKQGDVVTKSCGCKLKRHKLQELKPRFGHIGSVGHAGSWCRRHHAGPLPYPTTQMVIPSIDGRGWLAWA